MHIILLGGFHLNKNYLSRLGAKLAHCGFGDILLEANLTTGGALLGILNCSGKLYNKTLYIYKVVMEALERLILMEFLYIHPNTDDDEIYKQLLEFEKEPSRENLQKILEDKIVKKKIDLYLKFLQQICDGNLGPTGKFWMSVVDDIKRALYFDISMKTNNYDLYKWCLHEMSPIFYSWNGQNYARYLPYYASFISNIETTHPGATKLLKAGAISASKSTVKGCRIPNDMTVEVGINKHGKSRGFKGGGSGFSGLYKNEDSLQRLVRTTHVRAGIYQQLLKMVNLEIDLGIQTEHYSLRKIEIERQEHDVTEVIDIFQNRYMNPFQQDNGLYIVSSGVRVRDEITKDILARDEWGVNQRNKFIKDRLQGQAKEEKERNIHAKIKKCKLKDFNDMFKVAKLTATNRKIVNYTEQQSVLLQLLVKSQELPGNRLDLGNLVTYPLQVVPSCFGTPDGVFNKTNKAKAYQHITKAEPIWEHSNQKILSIIDGNSIFYQMKNIPDNFEDIAVDIFTLGIGSKSDVVFSTDFYNSHSLKAHERDRRGTGETFNIKGVKTKKPPDWKTFLKNDSNKKQLCFILKKVWTSDVVASKLKGKKVILVVEGEAVILTSDGQKTFSTCVPSLSSSHDETDRRVIQYIMYGERHDYQAVVVRTPDGDLFFNILHYCCEFSKLEALVLDIGMGLNRKSFELLGIAKSLGRQKCTALLGVYIFTGEDCNSSFKGKGKVKAIKLMEKSPEFIHIFSKLGEEWEVPTPIVNGLEKFTCALYGLPRYEKVNKARLCKLKTICGSNSKFTLKTKVNFHSMPPCRNSLLPHIKRVNYQASRIKKSHITFPDIPDPDRVHGWVKVDGKLEPLWTDGDILPSHIIDLMSEELESDNISDARMENGNSGGDIMETDSSDDEMDSISVASSDESGADSDFSD